MRVLMIEPMKEPYVVDIGNDLKSMQDVVGGLIEVINLEDDIVMVDNEEGKLIGLEGNRRVGRDIIAGTFFLCGSNDEGEFVSLTEEQIDKYTKRFKESEYYTAEQVENSIRIELYSYDSIKEMYEDLEV
ncbi:MAG: DUF3846 domain-containing protein [Clostridiaceae bacterium]|nr:DUF3846 domain-containing protein [Clostridiaceae bacterium]